MAGWSEAGSNLTTVDNVGIGTTNPQSALHANGVVTVSPGSGSDSRVLLGPGGDGTSLIKSQTVPPSVAPAANGHPGPTAAAFTDGSQLTFATYPIKPRLVYHPGGVPALRDASSAAIDRLSIDSAGQVGIGTTAPLTTLDVRGHACFQGRTGDALATVTMRTGTASAALYPLPSQGAS
jgi:hypothetical protein